MLRSLEVLVNWRSFYLDEPFLACDEPCKRRFSSLRYPEAAYELEVSINGIFGHISSRVVSSILGYCLFDDAQSSTGPTIRIYILPCAGGPLISPHLERGRLPALTLPGGWPTHDLHNSGCRIHTRSYLGWGGLSRVARPQPLNSPHATRAHDVLGRARLQPCHKPQARSALPLCRRPSRSPQGAATELPSFPPPQSV